MSELTQEQQAMQAEAARLDALLGQVITDPAQATREAAGRSAGILSPEKQNPKESRVVLSCVRTEDGRWWASLQGVGGVISQMLVAEPAEIESFLAAGVALTTRVLMSDAEHAAARATAEGGPA
jgi:hypothetical protein